MPVYGLNSFWVFFCIDFDFAYFFTVSSSVLRILLVSWSVSLSATYACELVMFPDAWLPWMAWLMCCVRMLIGCIFIGETSPVSSYSSSYLVSPLSYIFGEDVPRRISRRAECYLTNEGCVTFRSLLGKYLTDLAAISRFWSSFCSWAIILSLNSLSALSLLYWSTYVRYS